MTRIAFSVLAAATILVGTVAAQTADERSVLVELERVIQALGEGDADYFEDHYVAEVSRIHLTGSVDVGWDAAKAEGVRGFMGRGWRLRTTSYEVADVRVYGDVAVTAGVANAVQTMPGASVAEELTYRFSYVWLRRDGRWVELHHHVSRLE